MNDHSLKMNLLTKNTCKILNFLLRNSELYNINQISRMLGMSIGSVHKILKDLEKRNIILSRELGNALYYALNFDSNEALKLGEIILIEEKSNFLKNNKVGKVYASDLEKGDADCIVLFGSILTKSKEARDIDVLFIVKNEEGVREVHKFCLEISKIRTKKINPLIMLEQDLISNMKKKNKAMLDLIKNGVILKGEEVFIKIIKNAY